MRLRPYLKYALAVVGLLAAACGAAWHFLKPGPAVPEARGLRGFVRARPAVAVVFTSRTDPAFLGAAAPEGGGFTYPGTIPWAARAGRLRLLDTDGKVYELTWGRELPGGGTLTDVMGPSVSLDGKRILFAGRKAPPDAGRWRIYEVGVDGHGLKPLTGGPDDPGCVTVPPLRFAGDGTRLADAARRRLDYDDVDPTDLGPSGFAFASSRLPDLGRDHARRATQIWKWPVGAATPVPLSANRNNDRWPVLVAGDRVLFSQWGRNREAVTADLSDVRPVSAGGDFATDPPDHWTAGWVRTNGALVGYGVKCPEPVWRPRPLFNGRVAFATAGPGAGRYRLAQADWGYLRSAPSSLAPGAAVPDLFGGALVFGPARDADGRELTAGCPGPCPDATVLFAAAPIGAPAAFGLYRVADDWTGGPPVPELLFDDPTFADAEPAAVYARGPEAVFREEPVATSAPPAGLSLAGGRRHTGAVAYLENLAVRDAIRSPIPRRYAPTDRPGDPRYNPVIPPPGNVAAIALYAAHRDRFDDPERPRVAGAWEKVMTV
ncbi:MAG: hypothetical protein J0I06_20585, partial [Planctomycetes bacterium]|nr:hypothetical protein [Planctomycetota bacterium]